MFDSVYVHVPFCRHRCGYCNFTLVADRDDLIEHYLEAIKRELLRVPSGIRLQTLFLGGGTPTHLPGPQLTKLLDLLTSHFLCSDQTEFSLEANPIDITADQAARIHDAGVRRVSLGGQSWDTEKLQLLERDHRGRTIDQACNTLRAAGIVNLSVDLIFGVPGESRETWSLDLQRCLESQPTHVSTYGLTYEKGTRFWTQRRDQQLQPVSEDDELWMYREAIEKLTQHGWQHYEVSNFARPTFRCRHNEAYWTGQEFEAFGPGAARYVNGTRSVNHRSTTTYLKRVLAGESPVAESETLSIEDRARERFVFGMRRLEGVDLDQLRCELQVDLEAMLSKPLQQALDAGWLRRTASRIQLTESGLMLSDSLWPEFL